MSTKHGPDEPYGAYALSYNVEMLQTQVFGAFYSLVQFRRTTVGLTNAEVARRGGWTRSMITKTLGSPSNWTLKTISELATALDVDFKFCLVDRTDRSRSFDANGILFDFEHISQEGLMGEPQARIRDVVEIRQEALGNGLPVNRLPPSFEHLFEMKSVENVGLETKQS